MIHSKEVVEQTIKELRGCYTPSDIPVTGWGAVPMERLIKELEEGTPLADSFITEWLAVKELMHGTDTIPHS